VSNGTILRDCTLVLSLGAAARRRVSVRILLLHLPVVQDVEMLLRFASGRPPAQRVSLLPLTLVRSLLPSWLRLALPMLE